MPRAELIYQSRRDLTKLADDYFAALALYGVPTEDAARNAEEIRKRANNGSRKQVEIAKDALLAALKNF